jgi:hypothetical protein
MSFIIARACAWATPVSTRISRSLQHSKEAAASIHVAALKCKNILSIFPKVQYEYSMMMMAEPIPLLRRRLSEARQARRRHVCVPPVYEGNPDDYVYVEYCTPKRSNARRVVADDVLAMRSFVEASTPRFRSADRPTSNLAVAQQNLVLYEFILGHLPGLVGDMVRLKRIHRDPHQCFEVVYSNLADTQNDLRNRTVKRWLYDRLKFMVFRILLESH